MAITLSELYSYAITKYSMRLVAGKRGMGNTVRWIHMIEDRQVPEYLHGNELIFTTGIGHVGTDPLLNFTKKLNEYHAAGLVINIGPYISQISEDVIVYCKRANFPIFTIPWQVYVIDIIYDLCHRIIENEKSEAMVSDTFKKLIVSPESHNTLAPVLEQKGFSRFNPYTVLSVRFLKGGKNVTRNFSELHTWQLWNLLAKSNCTSAMFAFQDQLVVIRQNVSRRAVLHLEAALSKAVSALDVTYVMGISSEARGFFKVPELLQQAESARLTAELHENKISFYQDIGINKLLLSVKGHPDILRGFADGYLSPILEYDKKNHTDFAILLQEYLKLDGSVQAVAVKLQIHRNTVNSKIKQIKELFSLELTGEKKMELLLAFAAKEIADYLTLNGGN